MFLVKLKPPHAKAGGQYAMKVLDKKRLRAEGLVESVLEERELLARVGSHPFVVELLCAFQGPGHIFFVMEFGPADLQPPPHPAWSSWSA